MPLILCVKNSSNQQKSVIPSVFVPIKEHNKSSMSATSRTSSNPVEFSPPRESSPEILQPKDEIVWHLSVESPLSSNDEKSNYVEQSEINVSDLRIKSTSRDVSLMKKSVNCKLLFLMVWNQLNSLMHLQRNKTKRQFLVLLLKNLRQTAPNA